MHIVGDNEGGGLSDRLFSFFFLAGDWWEFKSPTYQLSSTAHKRQLRLRPLKLDRGLCCLSWKIATFSCRAGGPSEMAQWKIEMFHRGKMNRCIIIQMQSYATQSLDVKCGKASLRVARKLRSAFGGGKKQTSLRGVAPQQKHSNWIIVTFWIHKG